MADYPKGYFDKTRKTTNKDNESGGVEIFESDTVKLALSIIDQLLALPLGNQLYAKEIKVARIDELKQSMEQNTFTGTPSNPNLEGFSIRDITRLRQLKGSKK